MVSRGFPTPPPRAGPAPSGQPQAPPRSAPAPTPRPLCFCTRWFSPPSIPRCPQPGTTQSRPPWKPHPTPSPGCTESLPRSLQLDTVGRFKAAGPLAALTRGGAGGGDHASPAWAPSWSPKVGRRPRRRGEAWRPRRTQSKSLHGPWDQPGHRGYPWPALGGTWLYPAAASDETMQWLCCSRPLPLQPWPGLPGGTSGSGGRGFP